MDHAHRPITQNGILSTVQPVPTPFSTNALARSRINDGGSSQKEILFNRGKAINIISIDHVPIS